MRILFLNVFRPIKTRAVKHSHDNINKDNGDKTLDVESVVKSESATENHVEVEEFFEDDKS